MVIFDTPLLIYGFQGGAMPANEAFTERTRDLVRQLKVKRVKLAVPTPALAEFLVKLPPTKRKASILSGVFSMLSFTPECAQIAAELQADLELIKEVRRKHKVDKQCLKSDAMIIATAIAYKANSVYTNDPGHFSELAQGRIPIQGLMTTSIQSTLMFEAKGLNPPTP